MSRNPDTISSLPSGRAVLNCLMLAAVTLAAYWPVLSCGFLNYDDDLYVTKNQHVLNGLSIEGIQWAFSIENRTANWHPLTWLSHMLDCDLFGQRAGLHHLTNLLIHTASVLLLLWVLASMTGRLWPSFFVAAVFAIHPIHVESVAWIAERKDVLGGFFWILTIVCYHRYTRTHGRGSYLLTLFCFGLGLMAKPMLVTLPFVLLLLDFWPLDRLGRGSMRWRIAEKIPFFVLSAASCVVTFIAQRASGAVWAMESLPFTARLSNAVVSYAAYIVMTVWPVRLAVLYPLRQIALWQFISALIALITVTAIALLLLRRRRYVAVGWLWYVGTLVPVIGLVQVGAQRLADRYTYIPLIGLCLIAAWAVSDVTQKRPALRPVWAVTVILVTTAMFIGTRNQLRYWTDSISLCSRAIQVTEKNHIMHYNLGNALARAGQWKEAITQYRCDLRIFPDDADAHVNLGLALSKTDQLDEAIVHYRHALEINPDNVKIYNNIGNAMARAGQLDQAAIQYHHVLLFDPNNTDALFNLGNALKQMDQLDEAIVQYRHALEINPNDVKVHDALGNAFIDAGQLDEAINQYRRLVELQPEYPEGFNNLAWILTTASDPTVRNPAQAIELAQKACELTDYQNPSMMETLAAAYAGAGRIDEAVSTIEKALKTAQAKGYDDLIPELKKSLKRFKEGQTDTGQSP